MAAITTAVVLCSSAVGYRVVAQRPPADTPPRLLNKAEVDQALARIYPPLVRDAGIGGATEVLVDVDRAGRAHGFRVVRTDHPALATAAEQALGIARFAPAEEGGVAVAGTFRYSARFSAPTLPVAGGRTSVSVAGARARLSNAGELTAAAARLYPPLVRAAGISGRALVDVSRDAAGQISAVRVVSATHPAFAAPAEAAAKRARFAAPEPGDVRLVFDFQP